MTKTKDKVARVLYEGICSKDKLWLLSRTKEVLLQMSDNNFMEGDLVKWMKLKPLTLDSTNTLLGECTGILPVASQCSQWKTTDW